MSGNGMTPLIRVVCRDPGHGASRTVAELQRKDRWDGSGRHYWVKRAKMSSKERDRWQRSEPGDGSPMPRDYRDWDGSSGFFWLRHGQPVPRGEGYAIGQAFHHNARERRTGTPEPGVLEGVVRVFELPRCRCGANGVRATRADVVECILDELWARGFDEVELTTFSALTRNTPGHGVD